MAVTCTDTLAGSCEAIPVELAAGAEAGETLGHENLPGVSHGVPQGTGAAVASFDPEAGGGWGHLSVLVSETATGDVDDIMKGMSTPPGPGLGPKPNVY